MKNLEKICYEKNYIKSVIFRIDYAFISNIRTIIPEEFLIKVIEKFPKFETKEIITQTINVKELKTVSSSQNNFNNFEFSTEDNNKKMVISANYFTMEYKIYEEFNEFKTSVEMAFNALKDLGYILDINRVGLRYINEIILEKGNPFQWDGIINESLICGTNNFPNLSNISRKMTQVNFNYEDDFVNFYYGIANSEYPAKISKKEFVLDYDCSTKIIKPNEVLNKLESFHTIIQELFEFSIGEELRKEMGEKKYD